MAATKSKTPAVEIKDEDTKNGKTDTVYKVAQSELDRLSNDDAAGRKVDKAMEDARGKDTWRTHIQLVAVREVDDRAESRFVQATNTRASQFDAVQKKADSNFKETTTNAKTQFTAIQKTAEDNKKALVKLVEASRDTVLDTQNEHHSEAISLAEQQFADTNTAVGNTKAEIIGEVATTRDEVLNGQAILGEAINSAQKAAAKDSAGIVTLVEKKNDALSTKTDGDRDVLLKRIDAFDAAAKSAFDQINNSVTTVHENLARSQDQDGKTILETLRAQHEATLELVKSVHSDLDTKLRHFREEVANDMEKTSTTSGNQHASVRGDLNVVMSLLSDIRKDQIGRPDRR